MVVIGESSRNLLRLAKVADVATDGAESVNAVSQLQRVELAKSAHLVGPCLTALSLAWPLKSEWDRLARQRPAWKESPGQSMPWWRWCEAYQREACWLG